MTMLSAAQLLQRFDVFGRYREVELGGKVWSMRSHLEIMATELKADPTQRDGPADLVAVMMNPGGSRPLSELDAQGWAPALPDRTQYQLMRLAQAGQQHGLKIRHIRVINLSDLRTPKSAELMRALTELAPLGVRGSIHSIFGACRRNELAAALGPTDVPVLRAWGLGRWLAPLARQAVAATAGAPTLGLSADGLHYRHPLPQRFDLQQAWLAEATAQWLALNAVLRHPQTVL